MLSYLCTGCNLRWRPPSEVCRRIASVGIRIGTCYRRYHTQPDLKEWMNMQYELYSTSHVNLYCMH